MSSVRIINTSSLTETVDSLAAQAWGCRNTNNAKAHELATKARWLAEEAGYGLGMGCSSATLAFLDYRNRCYVMALEQSHTAITMLEAHGETLWLARFYGLLGNIYFELGERAQALDYLRKQSTLGKQLGDKELEATALHDSAFLIAEGPERIQTLERATSLFEQADCRWGMAYGLFNISECYFELGNCSCALAYAEHAFAITTELVMVDLQILILALQANCYGALHDEGLALALSEKAIGLAKTQQPEVLADSYLSLGRLYQTLDRPTDALPVLHEVLALAGAFKEQAMKGNQLLAKCYETVGDYRIAYKHHQVFHQLFAEMFTEDSERRMRALEVMHQIQEAKREAELERAKTLALESYVKKLEASNQQVRELSVRDELTGLHNRRYLTDQLKNLFDEARYRSSPLSLILLDIDHFKVINDTFGHLVGDTVLKQVAELLVTEIRGSDIVARFGGEEFAVLLPESSLERAILMAERIRVVVESAVRPPLGSTQTVTVSLGVAVATGYKDVDMLLGQADAALYQAKRSGRNRVCPAMSQPPTT